MSSKVRELVKNRLPSGLRVFLSGRKLLLSGEPEARLLVDHVVPGSIAIDVGANVGKYSYVLGYLVGRNGTVVCIEPVKEHADMLRVAARQLRLPFDVRQCVVSSMSGATEIRIPVEDGRLLTGLAGIDIHAEETERRAVDMTTIDQITQDLHGSISFIKIDTEGHEMDVLQGADRTLREHKPAMLIEIEERHSHRPVEDVMDLLYSYGYEAFFLDASGKHVSSEYFTTATHQRAHVENLFSKEYINNFLFVHSKPDA